MKVKYYESGYIHCNALGKCVYPDICSGICKYYKSGKAFDQSIDCGYEKCRSCGKEL